MFKNLTDNAKNIAANAKIEDMGSLFKNRISAGKDVKNAMSNIMVSLIILGACHVISDDENSICVATYYAMQKSFISDGTSYC